MAEIWNSMRIYSDTLSVDDVESDLDEWLGNAWDSGVGEHHAIERPDRSTSPRFVHVEGYRSDPDTLSRAAGVLAHRPEVTSVVLIERDEDSTEGGTASRYTRRDGLVYVTHYSSTLVPDDLTTSLRYLQQCMDTSEGQRVLARIIADLTDRSIA